MFIANNATYKFFVSDYRKQNNNLASSMSRLSSGQRMNAPGEAPADLGISERFRRQIRSADSASRTIQNATNMFQSADSWLQEIHNILNRMSELAVGSTDGSKTQADRENLNLEFLQLKQEVARIAEAGKYNGLQVNGRTAVAVYDDRKNDLVIMQPDGSDKRYLGLNLAYGQKASDGKTYNFEQSSTTARGIGDFVFSEDGKSLVWIAQSMGTATSNISAFQTLMMLNIANNTLQTLSLNSATGYSATDQSDIVLDDKGGIWISEASAASEAVDGQSLHIITRVETEGSLSRDTGGAGTTNEWVGLGTVRLASSFSRFQVFDNYVYFFERSAAGAAGTLRFVKQSIFDRGDLTVMVAGISGTTIDLNIGDNYSISKDGQYVAYENGNGVLNVLNTYSGKTSKTYVRSDVDGIVSFDWDHNNNLYWTDAGDTDAKNGVYKARIAAGNVPTLYDISKIHEARVGEIAASTGAGNLSQRGLGLAVLTGSPAGAYTFQVGPDAGMKVEFTAGDSRLVTLGISTSKVDTVNDSLKAISEVQKAIGIVSLQRAKIGSQVSRLGFTLSANDAYKNNIASAESRLRDVDFAEETAKMTSAQIMSQASLSILTQSNSSRASILSLFQ